MYIFRKRERKKWTERVESPIVYGLRGKLPRLGILLEFLNYFNAHTPHHTAYIYTHTAGTHNISISTLLTDPNIPYATACGLRLAADGLWPTIAHCNQTRKRTSSQHPTAIQLRNSWLWFGALLLSLFVTTHSYRGHDFVLLIFT